MWVAGRSPQGLLPAYLISILLDEEVEQDHIL